MYRCNQNFELAGQDMRKCQGNGEWSGEAPTCEGKPGEGPGEKCNYDSMLISRNHLS